MSEVFTPLNESKTERLKFDMKDVEVVEDKFWSGRGLGHKATVKIKGDMYKVFGISCGLPNCQCDAYLKPLE